MSIPVISVIVPNYNHSKYLEQRLASIFNETYQDSEVIILDDCSTDNSRDIIERYRSNPKLSKIIYNEVNSGSPFKQWHKGIQLAKGEYVWIAESDDYCTVDFLQKIMVAFEADKKCTITFCRTKSVNEVDCHCEIYPLQSGENKSFSMNGYSFSKRYMKRSNFIVNARVYLLHSAKYNYACNRDDLFKLFNSHRGNTILDFLVALKHLKSICTRKRYLSN